MKSPINDGGSTSNAGFSIFRSPSELIADLKIIKEEKVFELVGNRIRGMESFRTLLGDKETDFKHYGGYELFRENNAFYTESMEKLDYLNAKIKPFTGANVFKNVDKKIEAFGYQGVEHMIENTEEGQVDSVKMYASLLKLAREKG